MDAREEQAVWQRFIAEGDAMARANLIGHYTSLANLHAAMAFRRRQQREMDFDDFRHYALVGLIEAVDRYRPEGGASFRTFSSQRIRGAILNGIEKHSEAQEQMAMRRRLRKERVGALQTGAAEAGGDPFTRLVDIAIGAAIGFMLEDSGLFRSDEAYEHNIYRSRELRDLARLLEGIVDTLPDQEGRVIRYHYFQQMRIDDIAQQLDISRGRVSQIHHRALRRMREHYDRLKVHRTDY